MWVETTSRPSFPRLQEDRSPDVAVVGGGIAGLTTAVELAEAGVDVVLVEADRVGSGVTGRSTAKVTTQHGLCYRRLHDRYGADRTRQYARANEVALEAVADRCGRMDVDPQFDRRPAFTVLPPDGSNRDLEAEAAAARRVGLPATYVEDPSLPFEVAGAVRFDDQGQFHPCQYLVGLARQLTDAGGRIYERSRAVAIASDGRGRERVETEAAAVTADAVVVASHFPFVDRAGYFARMRPKRSYVVALRVDDAVPDGMLYQDSHPYRSVRSHRFGGEDLLLVGGQDHRTGQGGETEAQYRRLVAFAERHWDVDTVAYRWSTQDYVTVDRVPYVGRLGLGSGDVYVATGFGGWGMTNGTAAGMMLADTVRGNENPWLPAFRPTRLTGGRELLSENARTTSAFARGWLDALTAGEDEPTPGQARVVRHGGRPVGEYRDEDGTIHRVSAVCTHLACVVEWNDAERSWDCPCHGSRFAPTGAVIEGPATRDLSRLDDDSDS